MIEYGPDILTGGIASADSVFPWAGLRASSACDDNITTRWGSAESPLPHWWKYDLGSGVAKVVNKLRIIPYRDPIFGVQMKNFILQGSNNDIDWTNIYSGQHGNNDNWETFTFANSTPYRYYRLYFTSTWNQSEDAITFWEVEMMESLGPPVGEVVPWYKRYAPHLIIGGAIVAVVTYFSLRKRG